MMNKSETGCIPLPHFERCFKKRNLNLLDLPNEIFQLIAWHMDAPAFYISLLTCKKFMHLANCRRNVLRHIGSLPGTRLGLDDLSTAELLLVFRKRAAESLCGAGVLADVNRYNAITHPAKLSKAVFAPGGPALYATVQDFATVNVYELTSCSVRLKAELQPHSCETGCFDDIEISKIAFSVNRDLAVLYRAKRPIRKLMPSSLMNELAGPDSQVLRLATFHRLHSPLKGSFYSPYVYETRDIVCDFSVEPVGLAMASNGNACIAYSSENLRMGTEMMLVGRKDCMHDPSPAIAVIWNPPNGSSRYNPERLILNLQFVRGSGTILFFRPGNPVHSFFANSFDPASLDHDISSQENRELIDVEKDNSVLRFEVGMPFIGFHTAHIRSDDTHSPFCQFFYLAIGITEEILSSNVFIVQTSWFIRHSHCKHVIDLDKGRRSGTWKALALLSGWRQSTLSAGTVMAISPSGSRIAAATWSAVRIWTFDPMLLHQGSLEHYFPVCDYNARKGIGRLRPTWLSTEGVVHSLVWADENNLYATTDHGLVKWNMGHLSGGKRRQATVM